jgi:threonine 3-dehydrogenase
MKTKTILVIGANGQIGTALTEKLVSLNGSDRVVASDLHTPQSPTSAIFEVLNVLEAEKLNEVITQYQITEVYHLAAILSAKGEQHPQWAWEINMSGLFNVLEAARTHHLKVFFPSSIASFGLHAAPENTPQHGPLEPSTVYGISKVAGELWGQYYFHRYGLDVRSVRYPGIISHQSMPGGGTTDYAVEIFHKAVQKQHFTCFLHENTRLPMMYMDDALNATINIMNAPANQIRIRTSYNLAAISFTPAELFEAIKKHYPDFSIDYQPDFRQAIADSWPKSIDDSTARTDWGWQPSFDLHAITADMITNLKIKYEGATAN